MVGEESHDRTLEHFVQALDTAATLKEVEQAFAATLGKLGIKNFLYHLVRIGGGQAGRLPYIITNYPEPWIKRYFAAGYLDEDPVIYEALRRKLPFLWSDIAGADLNRRQRQFFNEAADAGISNGLTVPLFGPYGEAAMVSLIPDSAALETRSVSRQWHLLHLLAIFFHARAKSLLIEASLTVGSARRRSLLSSREREVLELVARGMKTHEIAAILSLSDKSIEFHVENAKRKLQVFSRTHAVVKAIMLGILTGN